MSLFPCLRKGLWLLIIGSTLTQASQVCVARSTSHPELSWTTEKWGDGDKPYRQIRDMVEQTMASSQKPAFIYQAYQKYEEKAKEKPSDPLAVFGWGYAAYRASLFPSLPGRVKLNDAGFALSKIPSPHIYEFTRLRFLIRMRRFPDSRLRDLGERLLQRDPKDYSVMYYFVDLLRPSIPKEKKRGLEYLDTLIRANPQKPNNHAALGLFLYRSWLISKNPAEGQRAIAAYRKHIQLAKLDPGQRKQVESMIQRIEKGLNKGKHG